MTIENDERRRRVTDQMCSVLQGTDNAGRTPEAEVAREALRAALRKIPEDATPEQVLELREAALERYTSATGLRASSSEAPQ